MIARTGSLFGTLLALSGCSAQPKGTTYHLYFLGGQSNMVGYGFTRELSPEQAEPAADAWIYATTPTGDEASIDPASAWAPVTPGFGVGYAAPESAPALGERFGPELSFARTLRELQPDTPIAIIKYARGGTSIDLRARGGAGSWDPSYEGLNQFDHAVATIRAAMEPRDLDGDGELDRLVPAGIGWMQGESDGTREDAAAAYEANLARLARALREELGDADLPFVVVRISDSQVQAGTGRVWAFGDAVRGAQEAFARSDPNAALVTSTDGYGYSDPYHYDTAGYLDMGARIAKAMHELGDD